MQNSNFVYWVLLTACLAAGFISGWTIKGCVQENNTYMSGTVGMIKVHDTIKSPLVEYRYIPGRVYNVDSLINVVNQFWKDSLKSLYGKGLFEAKFTKQDNMGKREITLESRIPVDPEAEVTLTEELRLPEVYPKRSLGIIAGLFYEMGNEITGTLGLKYYVMDYRNFSLTGIMGGSYLTNSFHWKPLVKVEMEVGL